jgi:hypothetical protein
MKRQKSCGPRLGKLVHQLPGVVTFAYDLRFRRVIARWKGIVEEIHFGGSVCLWLSLRTYISKKLHLGPQNGPGSENLLKIVNCQNGQKTVLSHLEKVGGPRYPPGSEMATWIHRSMSNVTSRLHPSEVFRCKLLFSPEVGQCQADHSLDLTIRKSLEASLN